MWCSNIMLYLTLFPFLDTGAFALDLTWVDNATGIKGAQIILRNDGSKEYTCNAVNPGPKCNTLSVAGHRYVTVYFYPLQTTQYCHIFQ